MKKELVAGFTTFLTMAYIIVVNPAILATEGTGIPFSGAVTATVLAAAFGTFLMGIYGKLPYALAPGMGLNAFFTYTLVLGEGHSWQSALGIVFCSGGIFVILSLTPFRAMLVNAIPNQLRLALAIGIGFFLTFIGLKNMGVVVSHPVTFVTVGKFELIHYISLFSLFIGAFLLSKKNPFALIVTIAIALIGALVLGAVSLPQQWVRSPDFSLVGQLDILSSLKLAVLPSLLSFMLTDLLDTLSTFIGVSQSADLKDADGGPKNLKKGMLVDAVATVFSGFVGTSPTTTYIESAAGVEVGGRTGMTAVFCALLFLPFLFLSPLIEMIPAVATGPVLVLVGSLMGRSIQELKVERVEEFLPAFLVIMLIPLTFSISQGIMYGFLAHIVLYALKGRYKEVHPILYLVTLIGLSVLH